MNLDFMERAHRRANLKNLLVELAATVLLAAAICYILYLFVWVPFGQATDEYFAIEDSYIKRIMLLRDKRLPAAHGRYERQIFLEQLLISYGRYQLFVDSEGTRQRSWLEHLFEMNKGRRRGRDFKFAEEYAEAEINYNTNRMKTERVP